MMLVRSSVRFSPIHGLGCFAEEDIKKGQVVWKFDPLLDLEFKSSEVENHPAPIVEFLKTYCYGQMKDGEKTYILCGDHARHMNHSLEPNLLEEGVEGLNIAARDIKQGEELTCDYTQFDTDAADKLKPH